MADNETNDASADTVGIKLGTSPHADGSLRAPTGDVFQSWPNGSAPDPSVGVVEDREFASAGDTTNCVGVSTGPHKAQFVLPAGRPD